MINGVIDTTLVHRIVFEGTTVLIEYNNNTAVSITWDEFQTMEVV